MAIYTASVTFVLTALAQIFCLLAGAISEIVAFFPQAFKFGLILLESDKQGSPNEV